MNFLHSVYWLITRFRPASCFCGSFLYVFVNPLFLVFFYIYLRVFLHFFSFPSLVSFVILHSFRSSICLCLHLSLSLSLSLSLCFSLLIPFSQHTNPYICIYFLPLFWQFKYLFFLFISRSCCPFTLHISDFYSQLSFSFLLCMTKTSADNIQFFL